MGKAVQKKKVTRVTAGKPREGTQSRCPTCGKYWRKKTGKR